MTTPDPEAWIIGWPCECGSTTWAFAVDLRGRVPVLRAECAGCHRTDEWVHWGPDQDDQGPELTAADIRTRHFAIRRSGLTG
jgi:hypothetical protein